MKQWINRFTPLYKQPGIGAKHFDIPANAVVTSGGLPPIKEWVNVEYNGKSGWVNGHDVEDYVNNFPSNLVIIENQTPNPNDFEQYMIYNGVTQVNMCGELCVCHALKIPLQSMLMHWQTLQPTFFKRVFGTGRARGTSANELQEMANIWDRPSILLTKALYQPHIGRSRYTLSGLKKLLLTGNVIVSVKMDASTGRLRGQGVLHWVSLTDIKPEKNNGGFIGFYNPASNSIEYVSWQEFLNAAGPVYGLYIERALNLSDNSGNIAKGE